MENKFLAGNEKIEQALVNMKASQNKENFIALLEAIRLRIREGGHVLVPVVIPPETKKILEEQNLKKGETAQATDNLRFAIRKLKTKNDSIVFAAFTSREELKKGDSTSVISESIDTFFRGILQMPQLDGVVLNPWGESFFLSKDMMQTILNTSGAAGKKGNMPS